MSVVVPFPTRPQGRPGLPLPALSKRPTRVLLLASSYHDACQPMSDGTRGGGKPGSRLLVRNALWRQGSYDELEDLLDQLRAGHVLPSLHANMVALYRSFAAAYVGARFPDGNRAELGQAQKDAALHALGWLAKRMPASIYVPAEVSEAAGYTPTEARAFDRPRSRTA